MIGKRYKAHKDNVIDIFEGYKRKRGDLNDGVDICFLENRIESLKNGKFRLAVAGEVKAGKSTFINALLGEEILPSDVLQASSAIVEIFKSDKSFLKVKYADGREENIYDDLETPDINEAKERLQEICKISDEYRGIPTTLIDNDIAERDTILEVDNQYFNQLESRTEENLQEKREIIENYIKNRKKEDIPVEINFGYPLKWDFDELRIVDSPGVNAIGGVQDISFNFFEKANAILFVHPIKPVESESFKKFVKSVISDRSKKNLFLILTHAGLYSNEEVERLHNEAIRLYKDDIPENRILVVDSLLKIIHSDLERGISLEEIRKTENKKKILSSYREQAEEENRELIDIVLEASRFDKMEAAIDEFAMKAPYLQLQEILEKIKDGYEDQENQYNDKIDRLNKKKKNPQEFENEINRISKALDNYKLLMNKTEEKIKNKNRYTRTGTRSEWQKSIDELKSKYKELIEGSKTIDEARKHVADALNEMQDNIDSFSRELTEQLKKELEKVGKSFKVKYKISVPKVDLKAIEIKAKKEAYREKDEYETYYVRLWYTLWIKKAKKRRFVGTRRVLDNKKFLKNYKDYFYSEFLKVTKNLLEKSKEVRNQYLGQFKKEMNSIIEERQKALKEERKKKQSNEELIQEIKELNRKKNDIPQDKKRINEILEDIK